MPPIDVLHQHVGPTTGGLSQHRPSGSGYSDAAELVHVGRDGAIVPLGLPQMGLLPRSEARVPTNIDDQFTAIFYGRAASNLTVLRRALRPTLPSSANEAARDGLFASIAASLAVPPGFADHSYACGCPFARQSLPCSFDDCTPGAKRSARVPDLSLDRASPRRRRCSARPSSAR